MKGLIFATLVGIASVWHQLQNVDHTLGPIRNPVSYYLGVGLCITICVYAIGMWIYKVATQKS